MDINKKQELLELVEEVLEEEERYMDTLPRGHRRRFSKRRQKRLRKIMRDLEKVRTNENSEYHMGRNR